MSHWNIGQPVRWQLVWWGWGSWRLRRLGAWPRRLPVFLGLRVGPLELRYFLRLA